jgi:hypothetical protein
LAAADDLPSLAGLAGFAGAFEATGVPGFAVVRGSFGIRSSLDAVFDGRALPHASWRLERAFHPLPEGALFDEHVQLARRAGSRPIRMRPSMCENRHRPCVHR